MKEKKSVEAVENEAYRQSELADITKILYEQFGLPNVKKTLLEHIEVAEEIVDTILQLDDEDFPINEITFKAVVIMARDGYLTPNRHQTREDVQVNIECMKATLWMPELGKWFQLLGKLDEEQMKKFPVADPERILVSNSSMKKAILKHQPPLTPEIENTSKQWLRKLTYVLHAKLVDLRKKLSDGLEEDSRTRLIIVNKAAMMDEIKSRHNSKDETNSNGLNEENRNENDESEIKIDPMGADLLPGVMPIDKYSELKNEIEIEQKEILDLTQKLLNVLVEQPKNLSTVLTNLESSKNLTKDSLKIILRHPNKLSSLTNETDLSDDTKLTTSIHVPLSSSPRRGFFARTSSGRTLARSSTDLTAEIKDTQEKISEALNENITTRPRALSRSNTDLSESPESAHKKQAQKELAEEHKKKLQKEHKNKRALIKYNCMPLFNASFDLKLRELRKAFETKEKSIANNNNDGQENKKRSP